MARLGFDNEAPPYAMLSQPLLPLSLRAVSRHYASKSQPSTPNQNSAIVAVLLDQILESSKP